MIEPLTEDRAEALRVVVTVAAAEIAMGVIERGDEVAFLHLHDWTDEEIAQEVERYI